MQVNLLLTKWMKELEKIFYGNIVAYDAAIGKQDELQNVIWRYVFLENDCCLCFLPAHLKLALEFSKQIVS